MICFDDLSPTNAILKLQEDKVVWINECGVGYGMNKSL